MIIRNKVPAAQKARRVIKPIVLNFAQNLFVTTSWSESAVLLSIEKESSPKEVSPANIYNAPPIKNNNFVVK